MTSAARRRAAGTLVCGLAALALGGCGTPSPTSSSFPAIPLTSASVNAGTTIATLPLDAAGTTLWELLARDDGRWWFATPPDVATTGGMVAATGASSALTAGVLPSARLRFSPLTRSVDGGRTWTTEVAPGALAATPGGLVDDGARTLALLAAAGGTIVTSRSGLTTWTTVATPEEIAAATPGSRCRLRALTSLAVWGAALVAGGVCTARGGSPIAVRTDSGWRLVGPPITASAARVIRFAASARRVVALLELVTGATHTLIVDASSHGPSSWTSSVALVLGHGTRLVSTTVAPERVLVVLRTASGRLVARSWHQQAGWSGPITLPPRTFDVVFGGGVPEALSAKGVVVLVWARTSGRWHVAQRLVAAFAIGPAH